MAEIQCFFARRGRSFTLRRVVPAGPIFWLDRSISNVYTDTLARDIMFQQL